MVMNMYLSWLSMKCAWLFLVFALLVRHENTQAQPLEFVCDIASDDCLSAYDNFCDVPLGLCPNTTDCFDCDPCKRYSLLGCGNCTDVAGCVWCDKEARCVSQELANQGFPPTKLPGCTVPADFVSTCGDMNNEYVFSDPLYGPQSWVYDLMRVPDVWRMGYTGQGVHLRINDGGTDSNHPDIAANFNASLSCSHWLPPNDFSEGYSHGTFTAAIAAGAANNDYCSAGVAPDVTLSACRILGPEDVVPIADETIDGSYLLAGDINSNSWGADGCVRVQNRRRRRLQEDTTTPTCPFSPNASPCAETSACFGLDWSFLTNLTTATDFNNTGCLNNISRYCSENLEDDPIICTDLLDWMVYCYYNTVSDTEQAALVQGVTEGRNGKGIIYLFAPSNGYNAGSNVNFEGFMNSRFTISVGAVGKFGFHASYSTTGAALFVTGPGGDLEFVTNHMVAQPFSTFCIDAGVGTSFATPAVAGVVALLLQANPDLGWRDVQGILAMTSQKVDPENPSWITNSAGYHHSPLYGFGLVDAYAAVTAGLNWTNWGAEVSLENESASNLTISDQVGVTVSSTISISDVSENDVFTESIVVYLDLIHPSRGDLDIALTSPSGIVTLLVPGQHPENTNPVEGWKLMSLQNWGEPPIGDWTLSITDRQQGYFRECVDLPWTIVSDGDDAVCLDLLSSGICTDGGPGPNVDALLAEGLEGLDDPLLVDPSSGFSPTAACCACGGGIPAETVEPVLEKWKLVVHGHYAPTTEEESSPAPTDFSTPGTTTTTEDESTLTPSTDSPSPSGAIKKSISKDGMWLFSAIATTLVVLGSAFL